MREWVISFYLERINMTSSNQTSSLVFNEDTAQILLNSEDITENAIHVMVQWLIHTEAAIVVCNKHTQQQMLITCVDVSNEDLPNTPSSVH